MSKIEEIYDNHIWKELEKGDTVPPEVNPLLDLGTFMLLLPSNPNPQNVCISKQVYPNAIALLLRLDVRDALKGSFEDRLKLLAARLTDQVRQSLVG